MKTFASKTVATQILHHVTDVLSTKCKLNRILGVNDRIEKYEVVASMNRVMREFTGRLFAFFGEYNC